MLRRLLGSQGLKSTAVVAIGNIGGTAISAIAMIVLSRSLGPESFGVFSALFSLLVLGSRFTELGINIASQRFIAKHFDPKPEKAKEMAKTTFTIKLITALVLVVLALAFGNVIATRFLRIEESHLVIASIAFIGVTLLFEYYQMLLQARQKFSHSALMSVSQALAKLASVLVFAWSGALSVAQGIYTYGLAPLVGVAIGVGQEPWAHKAPKKARPYTKTLIKTAKWTAVAVLAASLADNVDVLLVKAMLSEYQTGIWAAANRIAAFASLIGISLGTVMSVRVARYKDKKHLDKYLRKSKIVAVLSIVLTLCLIPLSKILLTLTVGPEYLEAVFPLQLLFIATALTTATSPFVALFYLFEKPQYYAYSGILLSVVLIGGNLLFIPTMGIVGAGYVKIATRMLIMIFTLWYAGISYSEHIRKQ